MLIVPELVDRTKHDDFSGAYSVAVVYSFLIQEKHKKEASYQSPFGTMPTLGYKEQEEGERKN